MKNEKSFNTAWENLKAKVNETIDGKWYFKKGYEVAEEKLMVDLAEIGLAVIAQSRDTLWLGMGETVLDRILGLTTNLYKREIEHTEEGIEMWLESVRDGEVDLPKIKKE